MRVQIEVAPGELIDKLTILQIKLGKITDKTKLRHVRNEFNTLNESVDRLKRSLSGKRQHEVVAKMGTFMKQLADVNLKIWNIEDQVRDCESKADFGPEFVEAARSVYLTNDKRASIKKAINSLFQSDIQEEKSYTEYREAPLKDSKTNVDKVNQQIKEHSRRNKK